MVAYAVHETDVREVIGQESARAHAAKTSRPPTSCFLRQSARSPMTLFQQSHARWTTAQTSNSLTLSASSTSRSRNLTRRLLRRSEPDTSGRAIHSHPALLRKPAACLFLSGLRRTHCINP